ncbi:SEL1-like repeat protein [bacterium]|nr:SEL1-like repeat protein [bacterium]
MSAAKKAKGVVSNLTMFLLIIITALSVAVVMLYLQNQNISKPAAAETSGEPAALESVESAEPAETAADIAADQSEAAAEETVENAPEENAETTPGDEQAEAEPQEAVDPIKSCVTINGVSGTGSGFFCIIDDELYIVTCAHVVYEEPTLIIKDLEGHSLKVQEVLTAKDRDLALIKIEKPDFNIYPLPYHKNVTSLTKLPEVVCYGDSEGVGVIVKCEGKMLGIGSFNIETDTPFVSGNSGGPVLLKETNLVIAVAACLTRRSEGDKWAKGTRFENETRRFSVRFDNLKIADLEKTDWGKIDPTDLKALDKEAEKALEDGDLLTAYALLYYTASQKDTWALNKWCEILLADLVKKASNTEQQKELEADMAKNFKTFKKAADNKVPGGLMCVGLYYLYGLGVPVNSEEGFRLVKEAAGMGYDFALFCEGYCYAAGIGTDQDLEKAFLCYKKAAEQGKPMALNALGDCYHYGLGTTQNDALAKECFQKAADQNDAEGQWNMGFCYEYGIAVTADMEKAFSYYRKSAEQDYVLSCVKLGDIYYGKEDYKSAAALYLKAAKQKDPEAIYKMSRLYKYGLGGLPKDNQTEIELVKQAADMENIDAMVAMGDFYRFGYYAIQKNPAEAAIWFLKAAQKGSAEAKNYLGVMYENGECGESNNTQAFLFYKEAAESGNEAAWYNVGLCYLNGKGTERNLTQGVYWIAKAANAGYASAQVRYAQCYYNGLGVPMNYNSAFYWYEKAAREGEDITAMGSVGAMYENGWGVPRADYQKAAEWYAKAVQKGDPNSAYLLGNLYYYGKGVKRDYSYAKRLFQYAWEEGKNENARKMMLQCP